MSLTVRLALTYLLMTLTGLLLVGAGFVALAGRYLAGERERELNAQTAIYAALLGELAATPEQLRALVQRPPGGELLPAGTAVRVFSPVGALMVGDPALGPFPSRAALSLVRPAIPLPASQVDGRQYTARIIAGLDGPIGVVELSRDTAADTRLLQALASLVLQAALFAALLMGAVSALVARGIARPIVALTRQAGHLAAAYALPRPGEPPAAARGFTADDPGRPPAVDRRPPDAGVSAIATRKDIAGGSSGDQTLRAPRGLARVLGGGDELAALERSLARLDQSLRAYTARIGELEQARSRFYRGVSHELRTPLTAISGLLENLADHPPDDQRAAHLALEGEVARLGRLVDELLRPPDDGRLALLARAPVDLAGLAGEVAALLAGRARRAGVELRVVRAEGGPAGCPSPVVLGDRDRLKQALINLVDNALRVTPAGGAVVTRVETAGVLVRVAVEDGGPGVKPELRGRIWERGARGGDAATDGSAGLGLAIVAEIAAAHGGRAYLDEAWGPGARFVIEMARTQSPAAPVREE